MCRSVSLSQMIGAKWDRQKLENQNISFLKNEKPSLKATRIEDISDICNNIMYLLT